MKKKIRKQMATVEFRISLARLKKEVEGHMKEIADAAGVSIPTVSRVLNSKWTNERVIAEARKTRDRIRKEKLEQDERLIKLLA